MRFPFLVYLILLSYATSAQQITKEDVLGFWHSMPIVGSGYSEYYQFFEDGTFYFGHNQMDCADSIITEQGRYLLKKNKLTLNFASRNVITGGKLVPATGSCGSDFEIEGGTEVVQTFYSREKIKLSKFMTDPDYDYLKRMSFGKYFYWKLSSDPKID